MYLFVCVTSPGHTNNDTDLKFGTLIPIGLIYKRYFFDQITVTAASFEKLPRHVDFPHTLKSLI